MAEGGQFSRNLQIIPDSSIDLLAKKYGSSVFNSGKDQNEIRLKSRVMVYGTAFPSKEIEPNSQLLITAMTYTAM